MNGRMRKESYVGGGAYSSFSCDSCESTEGNWTRKTKSVHDFGPDTEADVVCFRLLYGVRLVHKFMHILFSNH